MKKMTTLYKKDPNDLGRVINEVNPENEWVFEVGTAIPTRKFDGTACAIINGELYKRYDAKIDKNTGKYKKPLPNNIIECCGADIDSGHHPHWMKCFRDNPADKYHFIGFDSLKNKHDGTYELCGEKVQGNPENIIGHELIRHGSQRLNLEDFGFNSVRDY